MFGLVNVVFRPADGLVADLINRYTKSVWGKKVSLVCLRACIGASALVVGLLDPHSEGLMFGPVKMMAFFIAASNGAILLLCLMCTQLPMGLSRIVGGMGNFGGIVFAIIFRYNGAPWIIGEIVAGINIRVSWIRPVP